MTAEDSDDLIWLFDRTNSSIDGPRTFCASDVDWYTHWAPCEAPETSRVTLASAPVAGEAQRIFLVPTGEVYCGQETYTRHEGQPPVNTDNECLYVAPQASAAVRNAAQEVVLSALDPAIAFHLIDRYAENWTHTGVLMERWARAWVEANPETTAKEQAKTSDTMSTSHP